MEINLGKVTSLLWVYLELLTLQVHLDQWVSHQVAKATAIEIAVWFGVVPVVVNVREFQSPIIQQFIVMQIFSQAEHLGGDAELLKKMQQGYTNQKH